MPEYLLFALTSLSLLLPRNPAHQHGVLRFYRLPPRMNGLIIVLAQRALPLAVAFHLFISVCVYSHLDMVPSTKTTLFDPAITDQFHNLIDSVVGASTNRATLLLKDLHSMTVFVTVAACLTMVLCMIVWAVAGQALSALFNRFIELLTCSSGAERRRRELLKQVRTSSRPNAPRKGCVG